MTTEPSAEVPKIPETAIQLGADELRYLLVAELAESRRAMTIAELVNAVEQRGARIVAPGNESTAGKVVSDSLRWEKAKGRVHSVSRDVYASGSMPRSTRSWIRKKARLIYNRADANSLPG